MVVGALNSTVKRYCFMFRTSVVFFCRQSIYKWMKQGADLRSMLPYLSAYMGHSCISHTAYYIHLVPEFFSEMSGMDMNLYASLIPEVPHE